MKCRRWFMGKQSSAKQVANRWRTTTRSGGYRLFREICVTFVGIWFSLGKNDRGADNLYNNNIYKNIKHSTTITHAWRPPAKFPRAALFQSGPPPPPRGGNYSLKNPLFNPYPAIPPYYVRTPHPGAKSTKQHASMLTWNLCLRNGKLKHETWNC